MDSISALQFAASLQNCSTLHELLEICFESDSSLFYCEKGVTVEKCNDELSVKSTHCISNDNWVIQSEINEIVNKADSQLSEYHKDPELKGLKACLLEGESKRVNSDKDPVVFRFRAGTQDHNIYFIGVFSKPILHKELNANSELILVGNLIQNKVSGIYEKSLKYKKSNTNNSILASNVKVPTNFVAIYELNTANVLYSTQNLFKYLGYDDSVKLAPQLHTVKKIIHEDDMPMIDKLWKKCIEGQATEVQLVIRLRDCKGTFRDFLVNQIPFVFGKSKEVNSIMVYAHDISVRKELEHELETVKNRYNLAVRAGKTSVWEWDMSQKELYVDFVIRRILGYSPNEVVQSMKNEKKLSANYTFLRIIADARKYTSGESQAYEKSYRFKHKLGYDVWLLIRGQIFHNSYGEKKRLVGTVTDITRSKLYEHKLLNSHHKYRTVFENVKDIIFQTNEFGEFIFLNPSWGDLTGYDVQLSLNSSFYDFVHKDDKFILQMIFENEKKEGNLNVRYQLRFKTAYNEYIWLELFIKRIFDVKGCFVGTVGTMTDITERKIYEQKIIEASKIADKAVKEKNNFLSVMSHEIRTPLNAIIGLSYLLAEQSPREDQVKILDTLQYSSNSLLRLINDILDYNKLKAQKLSIEKLDFDLHELILNVKRANLSQMKSSEVKFSCTDFAKIPKIIKGDPTRLMQILNNLISNAIKFTSKGEIKLIVDLVEVEAVSKIRFIVSDTGIGIPEDRLESIFEPFNQAEENITRRFGGTGLGLAIIKNLVDLLKGEIQVNSKENEGSEFIIILPFEEPKGGAADKDDSGSMLDDLNKKISILYVEDVQANQFLMESLCKMWNFELDIAENGKKALQMVAAKKYSLVLMDLHLPDMTGITITKLIKSKPQAYYKSLPIIALTAEVNPKTTEQVTNVGMKYCLSKPIDPPKLLKVIHETADRNLGEIGDLSAKSDVCDFEFIEDLYMKTSKEDYVKFLNLIIKEFSLSIDKLIDIVSSNDKESLRALHHKLKSTFSIFDLSSMDLAFDELKESLTLENDELVNKQSKKLVESFEMMIKKFKKKINVELTEQPEV
ncbi:PAS domain S-box protein [Aureibacter tunicatorum]|uniref:histidine kinase n=1 Tax=Aureibacter tunicatorum TaxID=866807 RepID=A0AAE4BSU9_9BACT|nr:PAS domain S-box protein [Aureibacter tunicatorum]MDR6239260.1 PAS domain S-box-containing protein [Aureibacter tunicatorum]